MAKKKSTREKQTPVDKTRPADLFFKNRKWKAFPFQREAWDAYDRGESGLIHVPTGSGKTYAATLGAFSDFVLNPRPGLKMIYLTPLRALTRDLELAMKEPVEQEGWKLQIESRTGDTKPSRKKQQFKNPPDVLLTTPESLALMISYPDAEELFKNLEMVVLDEWHELMASKRGSQTELNLSFLKGINADLRVWAVSASIGNLEEAAQAAVGPDVKPTLISAETSKDLDIEILLPDEIDSFPWAGHLGLALRDPLIHELDRESSTLLFTNTRSQAERWFASLEEAVPDMVDQMALHHSSLSREERERVEQGVKDGSIKWVVCTSSLDLGVDFQTVDRVVQIGSPKMIARFMQRAGRSAHRPGAKSRILFVPTNSWEILELEAVKKSIKRGDVESRRPLKKPIDVLLQHMVTLAAGQGLSLDELRYQLKTTYSFSQITQEELNWCLRFLTKGGESLQRYQQFHKLVFDEETGRYHLRDKRMLMQHRMSIGTIVSRESVALSYTNRKRIGSVEENFISKMKKGDVFQFSGKKLELVMIRDMNAYVKSTSRPTNTVPSWDGGLLPMSELMATSLRETLTERHPKLDSLLEPILEAQRERSLLPDVNTLLCEVWNSKDGEHLFVFPFAGRLVHEGLSQLWAQKFAQRKAATFSFAINEYGFEIMGPENYGFEELFDDEFFVHQDLDEELGKTLRLGELSQRQFREISSIAGLVFTGYPGARKTGRQMQVSSSLLFEVFNKFEPTNLLLKQSYSEVLQGALESARLAKTLERLSSMKVEWKKLSYPSPLSFPLHVGMGLGPRMSNESMEDKVARLRKKWERGA